MKRVIGLGAGGHAKVVIDILRSIGGFEIAGLLDANPALKGTTLAGIPVLGGDDLLPDLVCSIGRVFMGLGSVRATAARRQLFESAGRLGFEWVNAIHPRAIIAGDVKHGLGPTVMAGAILAPGVSLGDNVIVNHGAIVDHDCRIGNHVHIAPGARLSGAVRIGDGCHVGLGACILQGVSIGPGSTVGAGAVVIHDVPAGVVVAGVPARLVEKSANVSW